MLVIKRRQKNKITAMVKEIKTANNATGFVCKKRLGLRIKNNTVISKTEKLKFKTLLATSRVAQYLK